MKVAVNRCFGGFGLSDEAFERFLDRKGIKYFSKIEEDCGFKTKSYYEEGTEKPLYQHMLTEEYEVRADPDLIAVIEEMGEKSFGNYAEIEIVEVPDDVAWHIHEYDGMEHVAENHMIW